MDLFTEILGEDQAVFTLDYLAGEERSRTYARSSRVYIGGKNNSARVGFNLATVSDFMSEKPFWIKPHISAKGIIFQVYKKSTQGAWYVSPIKQADGSIKGYFASAAGFERLLQVAGWPYPLHIVLRWDSNLSGWVGERDKAIEHFYFSRSAKKQDEAAI